MTGMDSTDKDYPVRSCVICRQRFAKKDLSRFVIGKETSDDKLISDSKKIMPGRGYYVCGSDKCQDKFNFFKPRKKKFRG